MTYTWRIPNIGASNTPINQDTINNTLAMARSLEPGADQNNRDEKEQIKQLITEADGKNRAHKYQEARQKMRAACTLLQNWTAAGVRN